MFRRNLSPPSSGSKSKRSSFPHASSGFLLGLFFDPENGGDLCSSETSFCLRTTQCYNPQYRTLYSDLSENLRSKWMQFMNASEQCNSIKGGFLILRTCLLACFILLFDIITFSSQPPAHAGSPLSRIFLPWRWRRYVLPTRLFTQDPHGATSQKTAFFIVTAVKTSNLT
jgi:hypothetical protein